MRMWHETCLSYGRELNLRMELGRYEISTPERQYDEACGAVHPKLFGPFSRHGHIQASKAILFWDDSLFDLQQTNLIGQ